MPLLKLSRIFGPLCGNTLLRSAVSFPQRLLSPSVVSTIKLSTCLSKSLGNCAALTQPNGQILRSYSLFVQEPSSDLTKLLKSDPVIVQQVRTYKVRVVLKRRCKGCYFEKREGRWFVECTLKPRHKQMQKVFKKDLYRDDYSKGNIRLAAHWGWRKKRFYWQGDNTPKDFYKPLVNYETTTVKSPV